MRRRARPGPEPAVAERRPPLPRCLISEMGHVALRTSRMEESLSVATELLGLRETAQDGRTAFLSASEVHHELMYIESDSDAVDHFGLVAADDAR